jgi:hypothetical protein
MISKKLIRRLEELEARLASVGEPHVIRINSVDRDGRVVGTREFVLPTVIPDRAWLRKRRWR